MKAAIALYEVAAICHAAVSGYRAAVTGEAQPEWTDLTPDEQGGVIDWAAALLTGRTIGDSPECQIVKGIISVVRDEKKTLKYA
ncbi:hypothetical protein [Lelliottia nimipressuralis]|uniref:Uncharacterized protein n=1 Tax=Lelliottia nimipressuralis TaxID=69220 RepID=A0ABD4KFB9_9ENTR|nr:hypothetical protein [Lelliottia nimipressuralis]MBF4180593.1 hypothetical protein [Lelliottia nimipressuralis]